MSEKDLQKEIVDLKAELRRLKKNYLGLVFEDQEEEIVTKCQENVPVLKEVKTRRIVEDDSRPNNLLIEGDNYHALCVLNYTHKKNIDLIYIDPPYNTGAKNWKYNNDYIDKDDEYRHSKWLSLMRHRLNLAKELLKDDGVFICAIDENEQAHLCVLIESIFPAHEQHTITIVHNPRGIQGTNFSYTHEYAIFVIPKDKKTIGDRVIEEEDIKFRGLRDNGGESLRTDARNCFYPIIVKNGKIVGFGDVVPNDMHPQKEERRKDGDYIYPIDNEGVERKWRYARQSIDKIKHLLEVVENKNGKEIQIGKDFGKYRTVWIDKKYDANEYGAKLLHEIIPDCDFNFPKSLNTVYDCVFAVVGSRPDANVLDFFAGSGTTGHAVLEMNKVDGGNRKFILCTNNENNNGGGTGGIAESVCYPRIKKVIEGYKNKKGEKVAGLGGNLSYYKTDLVDVEKINRIPDEAKIRVTYQAGEMIAVKEDTLNEVEKNEWWQVFEGRGRMTAIYFKEDKSKLTELIEKLEKKNTPVALYIFSWGKNEYKGEYSSQNIRVEDIPEPILEVYKEINLI